MIVTYNCQNIFIVQATAKVKDGINSEAKFLGTISVDWCKSEINLTYGFTTLSLITLSTITLRFTYHNNTQHNDISIRVLNITRSITLSIAMMSVLLCHCYVVTLSVVAPV
jgi:hypothetical protein